MRLICVGYTAYTYIYIFSFVKYKYIYNKLYIINVQYLYIRKYVGVMMVSPIEAVSFS